VSRINWGNVSTVVGAAILVGTELVGISWAAGWAVAGLMGLPPIIALSIEIGSGLFGFYLVFLFVRAAVRVEPLTFPKTSKTVGRSWLRPQPDKNQ
jgi:hypothetical protein